MSRNKKNVFLFIDEILIQHFGLCSPSDDCEAFQAVFCGNDKMIRPSSNLKNCFTWFVIIAPLMDIIKFLELPLKVEQLFIPMRYIIRGCRMICDLCYLLTVAGDNMNDNNSSHHAIDIRNEWRDHVGIVSWYGTRTLHANIY